MSRSNTTESLRNPSKRWFEFSAGADGGFVRYYDKEAEKNVRVGDDGNNKFVFLLLDELATVKGWHDPSDSGIFANEVRDIRQDTIVVRSFKGGEIASGLYGSIKDRVVASGGHFVSSCYIAYKSDTGLSLGNIQFKGASLSVWMEFKKQCPTKKDANGKSIKAYYVDAIKIEGFEQLTKGRTTYRVPKFAMVPVSEDTNKQAIELDKELQTYLSDYLKRPRVEAASVEERKQVEPEAKQKEHFDDMDDDIPWKEDESPF